MLFSFILDSTHASNDESDGQKKSQETLERNSKDVYEGIKYIAEMVTITNRNATPKFKIDLMIRELVRLVDVFWKFFWAIIGPFWDILTLRDTINDVIEFETSKEVDDSKLRYRQYDMLPLDEFVAGESSKPLKERKKQMSRLHSQNGQNLKVLSLVQDVTIHNEEEAEAFIDNMVERGEENFECGGVFGS